MKKQKKSFRYHFPFVIICILLAFSATSCSKKTEPSVLLAEQYYDYEISSDYTFQLDDIKLIAKNVHTLTEEEYYHFAECPVSFPMYLQFDETSMTALISSETSEEDLRYYLFRDENNSMLLIPENNRKGLFEQRRPLAFYLQEQTASACTKSARSLEELVSPDQSVFELASVEYDPAVLSEIAGAEGTLEKLNAQYPIKCLRKLEDGTYRASYLGKSEIASVCFCASGEKSYGWVYEIGVESTRFADLKIGDSLESVMRIDPNGCYLFLNTGRNDFPEVSEHYCNDGWRITIEYTKVSPEDWRITSIHKEWI